MDGNEVITVLKEIRDEAKQTNARIDQTNAQLESLEGRVDSLENRVSEGFVEVKATLDVHAERWDALVRRQTESELRLATEVISLASVTREVRDLIKMKLEDHMMVLDHEHRLKTLEERNGAQHP